MRVSIVLVLLVASSVWRTTKADVIIGSVESEGSFMICGEDANKACPQCCDEEDNCNYKNVDTSTACKPSGGIDCDKLCPSSSSKDEKDGTTDVAYVSDAGANAATVDFGPDGISVCGILLKDLCPECCDGDDCNFSTLSFTECPDPKTFDCSTICVIGPPAEE